MGGEGYRMLDASRLRQRQPSTSVVLVGVIAATVTALVWGIPALLFAYPLPGVAVFTAALTSVSALAVCVVFALRHRRSRRQTDFLLAALFGVIALVEGVLPRRGAGRPEHRQLRILDTGGHAQLRGGRVVRRPRGSPTGRRRGAATGPSRGSPRRSPRSRSAGR